MMKSDLWTGETVLSVLSFMSGIVPEEKATQTNADSVKVSAEPAFTTCTMFPFHIFVDPGTTL